MDTNRFTILIYRVVEGSFTPFKSYDARVTTFNYALAFYSKGHCRTEQSRTGRHPE